MHAEAPKQIVISNVADFQWSKQLGFPTKRIRPRRKQSDCQLVVIPVRRRDRRTHDAGIECGAKDTSRNQRKRMTFFRIYPARQPLTAFHRFNRHTVLGGWGQCREGDEQCWIRSPLASPMQIHPQQDLGSAFAHMFDGFKPVLPSCGSRRSPA